MAVFDPGRGVMIYSRGGFEGRASGRSLGGPEDQRLVGNGVSDRSGVVVERKMSEELGEATPLSCVWCLSACAWVGKTLIQRVTIKRSCDPIAQILRGHSIPIQQRLGCYS